MVDNSELGSNDQTSRSGLTVVLVEDSILMRAHLASSLTTINGIGVIRQAGDVPSGVRLLECVKPDVLILDIELPGQSGLDLLKIVRRRDPGVTIIMMTNHDHPKLRERCKEMGANFFFNKHTEFDQVAQTCQKMAEGKAPAPPQT